MLIKKSRKVSNEKEMFGPRENLGDSREYFFHKKIKVTCYSEQKINHPLTDQVNDERDGYKSKDNRPNV